MLTRARQQAVSMCLIMRLARRDVEPTKGNKLTGPASPFSEFGKDFILDDFAHVVLHSGLHCTLDLCGHDVQLHELSNRYTLATQTHAWNCDALLLPDSSRIASGRYLRPK